jgi:predicted nucleotide-binding protein
MFSWCGHDQGMQQTVARFLEKLKLRPIILSEQASKGRTIIEKFEDHASVPFAVVLLSPDDFCAAGGGGAKPHARQNVILELGYFIGKLGRENVCALHKEGVELPSDLHGVIWVPYEGDWKLMLAKEIKAAGIDVDLNEAFS